jgi:tRNA(adenine34) deaminase
MSGRDTPTLLDLVAEPFDQVSRARYRYRLTECRAAKVSAMTKQDSEPSDMAMMRRCVALAQSAGSRREYPFAAVIGRRGEFICESLNMVRNDRDVTRHAELVAISSAQRKLQSTSLDECTIYSTIEPCAMCAYAIRESRIGRVIFGLRSPVMGGNSRWNILTDAGLSSTLPEVFASRPMFCRGVCITKFRRFFSSGIR